MHEIGSIARLFDIDTSVFTPERDAEIAELERRREAAAKEERYRKAVPERYWSESLDSYRTDTAERKAAAEKARAFAQCVRLGEFRTLLLLGAVGTGKTHLACGIVRECSGTYRLSSAIVDELQHAKSFSSRETVADILDFYGSARLLVVDEIGRVSAAREEQYALYQIINARYNRRKPTVLISNQTKGAFLGYIGEAAADRLAESACAAELSGGSYRAEMRVRNVRPA